MFTLRRKLHLTSPLMKGKDVISVQRLVRVRADGQYGVHTAQAVYHAKYVLGYGKPNHTADERLVAYLEGRKKTSRWMRLLAARRRRKEKKRTAKRLKALALAHTQIGVHESPSGSNLQKYGVWYGMNGVAWCAIFVSWCFSHVGRKLRYSYVPAIVAAARMHRDGLSLTNFPEAGDLVCYDWPGESPGVADHVGIFHHWINKATGQFAAIEGNTSTSNNSNGGQVMFRTDRYRDEVQAFVRVS